MSYTPDDQLLEEPLKNAADSLEKLGAPIRERLKHPSEWNNDHLKELGELLTDITTMESRLRFLAGQVR